MSRFLQHLAVNRETRFAYWRKVSRASMIIFYAGVFSLFSCVGFISMLMQSNQLRPVQILIVLLLSGGCAVGYAAISLTRKYLYIALVGLAQFGSFALLGWFYRDARPLLDPHAALESQLHFLGISATLALIFGYALFLVFFSREGTRFFRAQTEVELAAEIHHALVPLIHKTIGSFEIYGASLPSGQVGGDLVDVAEDGETWMGYVADVSGHGVSSGVLMAMFKTAVRVRGVSDPSASVLLEKINRALLPLTMPNMFVTAALLQCHDRTKLSASLAGHPPLLHYSKHSQSVTELPAQSLPLGIVPDELFGVDQLPHEPGDIFVLLTDGLTEVFDSQGNELGIDPIKAALCRDANKPLPELFQSLRKVSTGFGRQEDDQTMLLVRQLE